MECLITRLKGSVNNNDLPVFNVLNIVLGTYSGNRDDFYFRIESGEEPITIKASSGYESLSGATVYEYSLPANSYAEGYLNNVVGNTLSVESVYTFRSIRLNKGFSSAKITGMSSAGEYGSLEKIQLWDNILSVGDLSDFKGLKAVVLGGNSSTINDMETFAPNNTGMVLLNGVTVSTSFLSNMADLQNVDIVKGDVSLLPTGLRRFILDQNGTGSIDGYVAKLRTAGKTSGSIKMEYAKTASNAYIGDISVKQYCIDNSITSNTTYLVWDSNTISITEIKPSDYVAPVNFNDV